MKFVTAVLLMPLMLAAAVGAAPAHEYTSVGIKIEHPWTRATPEGATTAVAYVKITNTGKTPLRLVGGSTPAAARVEIHEMSMDDGVMRMRPVPGVDIASGASVEFKAGGLHLMLVGLNKKLMQEDLVPLTLNFADGAKVLIELYVEGMGAGGGDHEHS
jgi:periplasmic copper chaperone A